MYDRMTVGELEILAYVWVETHDTHILDSLIFPHVIVETCNLRQIPVQGIAVTQRSLSYYRILKQVGILLKFTFPLNLDLIARSCYPL